MAARRVSKRVLKKQGASAGVLASSGPKLSKRVQELRAEGASKSVSAVAPAGDNETNEGASPNEGA